jgi:hypothetical protein
VSGGATQEKSLQFGEQTAFKRPGQTAVLTAIYVQLADPGASYATRQIYDSSGGAG